MRRRLPGTLKINLHKYASRGQPALLGLARPRTQSIMRSHHDFTNRRRGDAEAQPTASLAHSFQQLPGPHLELATTHFTNMQKGVGLGALSRTSKASQIYASHGERLQKANVDQLTTQFNVFQAALHEFSRTHAKVHSARDPGLYEPLADELLRISAPTPRFAPSSPECAPR